MRRGTFVRFPGQAHHSLLEPDLRPRGTCRKDEYGDGGSTIYAFFSPFNHLGAGLGTWGRYPGGDLSLVLGSWYYRTGALFGTG